MFILKLPRSSKRELTASSPFKIVDGSHVPVITCDRCHEPVQHHEDAVVLYEKPGAPVMIFHPDCEHEDVHQHYYSLPLETWLVEVGLGIGVEWNEAVRERTKRAMLQE